MRQKGTPKQQIVRTSNVYEKKKLRYTMGVVEVKSGGKKKK
jgi:hypothetical protein